MKQFLRPDYICWWVANKRNSPAETAFAILRLWRNGTVPRSDQSPRLQKLNFTPFFKRESPVAVQLNNYNVTKQEPYQTAQRERERKSRRERKRERGSHYNRRVLAHVMGWNPTAWNVGHSAGLGTVCLSQCHFSGFSSILMVSVYKQTEATGAFLDSTVRLNIHKCYGGVWRIALKLIASIWKPMLFLSTTHQH